MTWEGCGTVMCLLCPFSSLTSPDVEEIRIGAP